MARLLIIDPGLRSQTGHHYNMSLAISEVAKKLSLPTAFLGNAHPTEELPDLNFYPAFQAQPYFIPVYSPTDDMASRIVQLEKTNNHFSGSLDQVLSPLLQEGDVVFFHSPTSATIAGIGQWLEKNKARSGLRFCVLLNHVDYLNPGTEVLNEQGEFYSRFLETAKGMPKEVFTCAVDPLYLSEILLTLVEGDLAFQKSPIFYQSLMTKIAKIKAEHRVGYFGHTRPEKGTNLIPKISEHLFETHQGKVGITLHLDFLFEEQIWGEEGAKLRQEIETLGKRQEVTLITENSPVATYYAHLARCAVALIPYSGFYLKSVSGIFRETLLLGRTAVIPRNSWMYREAQELGFIVFPFDDWRPETIAKSTSEALNNVENALANNAEAARNWWKNNDLEDFIKTLTSDL